MIVKGKYITIKQSTNLTLNILIIEVQKYKYLTFMFMNKNLLKIKTNEQITGMFIKNKILTVKESIDNIKDNFVLDKAKAKTISLKIEISDNFIKDYRNKKINLKINNLFLDFTLTNEIDQHYTGLLKDSSKIHVKRSSRPLNEEKDYADTEKICVLVKGNPKYWIDGVSNKFYNIIRKLCSKYNYKLLEIESNKTGEKITQKGTIYILFSRGCGYDYHINKPTLGIGCCHRLKSKIKWYINNPNDKTCDIKNPNRLKGNSLRSHWTLTNDMIKTLEEFIKKYSTSRRSLTDTSTIEAITPYSKLNKQKIYRSRK